MRNDLPIGASRSALRALGSAEANAHGTFHKGTPWGAAACVTHRLATVWPWDQGAVASWGLPPAAHLCGVGVLPAEEASCLR